MQTLARAIAFALGKEIPDEVLDYLKIEEADVEGPTIEESRANVRAMLNRAQ